MRYILLLFFAFHMVVSANVCDANGVTIYSCDYKLKDDKCGLLEVAENQTEIIYVRDICDSDETCQTILSNEERGVCLKREYKKLEGESCVVNPECFSHLCTKKKCEAIAEGKECKSDMGCHPQYHCKDKICTKLIQNDKECEKDTDCIFNHACGKKDASSIKSCMKMFSLENDAYSLNPYLCKSGLIVKSDNSEQKRFYDYTYDTSISGEWKCANSLSVSDTCTVDSECSYKDGETTIPGEKGDCACDGKGTQGYCKPGSQTQEYQDYIRMYHEEVDNMELGEKDNVAYLRAFEWGIPKLIQARKNVEKYRQLKNIDKCAIRYITGSNLITISGMLLSLIALF